MKSKTLFGVVLTLGLGLTAATHVTDADAKPKKEEAPTEPPVAQKALKLSIAGIAWGESPKQLGDQIDKVIDADYAPQYKEVQPGTKMKDLDSQIAEDKAQLRRSRVDFGKLPTGLDASPLRNEYTYNNKEALYIFTRNGDTTYFFFIQERLWKIIEEKKLSATHPLGKTYQEAVVKMSTDYGVAGRLTATGSTSGAVEVDWKDATTHLRAIQRGDAAIALAFEDNGTVANLTALRPNKPVVDNGIDPEVAALMRPQSGDPGPPADKDKDKDKKKKK
jgi:hypothetical protein